MIKFYQETNNTPSEYKYIYKTNDTHIYELLSSNKPATLIVNDNRQNFSLQIPKDVLEVFKTKIAQELTSSVEDIIQNNNKYDKPTGSNALGKQALQQLGDGACHNDMNRLTDVVATCFIQYNNKQADLDLCILEDLYVNLAASHASKNSLTPETIRSPFGISITGKGGLYGNAFLSIAAQNTRSKSYYYKKFNNITEINSYFEPDLSYIKENIANYIRNNCNK